MHRNLNAYIRLMYYLLSIEYMYIYAHVNTKSLYVYSHMYVYIQIHWIESEREPQRKSASVCTPCVHRVLCMQCNLNSYRPIKTDTSETDSLF